MPAPTACPISEVDRALSSYIHSREDTLRIRRTLSKYLTSSLRPVNAATQTHHLNHECPHNFSAANTNPPGLKDTRLAYLQALRAKSHAQTKHGQLQASLEDLRTRHVDENPTQPESEYDNEVTRSYISLLRQRQRFAELQIIHDALDKLLSAKPSQGASPDPRTLVQSAVGTQPNLPAARLEQLSQPTDPDDQTRIFQLKQQVLEARARMQRAQSALQKAQQKHSSHGPPTSLHTQVHSLERAREEMIEWVQTELAKLEEDSIYLEDESPVKPPTRDLESTTHSPAPDLTASEHSIQESYNKYIAARTRLLDAHTSLHHHHHHREQEQKQEQEQEQTPPTDPPTRTQPTPTLLPHLAPLIHSKSTTQALHTQTSHLATRLQHADQATHAALLRLSGESHLVPAGTTDVAAWGAAAREAGRATSSFVEERLGEASRVGVEGVRRVVE
ncbi:hypothetical protein BDW02DRAFT_518770, partial [Decorospora gaudefroyi]